MTMLLDLIHIRDYDRNKWIMMRGYYVLNTLVNNDYL